VRGVSGAEDTRGERTCDREQQDVAGRQTIFWPGLATAAATAGAVDLDPDFGPKRTGETRARWASNPRTLKPNTVELAASSCGAGPAGYGWSSVSSDIRFQAQSEHVVTRPPPTCLVSTPSPSAKPTSRVECSMMGAPET
jgi:hypothetical protein